MHSTFFTLHNKSQYSATKSQNRAASLSRQKPRVPHIAITPMLAVLDAWKWYFGSGQAVFNARDYRK